MAKKVQWELIKTLEQLDRAAEKLKSATVMGVDTETTGLDPHTSKLRLIQIAVDNEPTIIIDCDKLIPVGKERIQTIMDNSAVKVFQNAKFDLQFLKAAGIEVTGKLFDTMLAAQLLRTSGGVRKVGLAQLALHYLGEEMSKEEQTSDFSLVLSEAQLLYAAKDAEVLLRLRLAMIEALKENHLIEVARLEFACVYSVAAMEYAGIHLDLEQWRTLTREVEGQQTAALEALYPYIGRPSIQLGLFESTVVESINLNSNKQVLKLLQKHGIHVENTSRHNLIPYEHHPVVEPLLMYRHATKALTTFLNTLPEQVNSKTGRLHPHYNQNGAYSGRMSCDNPNIQQIPRETKFRECFTAPRGRKLVIADYSQIELRVIAQFTGDQRMIEAYGKKEDLHKLTASLILQKPLSVITKEERQAAKAVNFGLVFGMGAAGLKAYAAETYGSEMTQEEAEVFKKRFFEGYEGVDRWQKQIRKSLPVESRTLSGRKFIFREDAAMSARYNTPIQGTAADILKNALGNLYLELQGRDTWIVAVVHDEIVLECPESRASEMAELLTSVMENAGKRYLKDVPVIAEASIADSWAGK